MKASEARDLTEDQLKDRLLQLKKEQFNLRFQRASGQLEKTSRVGEVRKDIAHQNGSAPEGAGGEIGR